MKVLSFVGLGLGVLAAGLAIYLHFVVVPDVESKELSIEILSVMEDDVSVYRAMDEQRRRKIEYGEYTLLLGALAFLVSVYPAIKRNKFALIGGVLGLAAFFIGAAYGTHMFS
tara:strand:- start:85 stop:423 length:339 start_codon:yes stop_codon:yes gene_type:complete